MSAIGFGELQVVGERAGVGMSLDQPDHLVDDFVSPAASASIHARRSGSGTSSAPTTRSVRRDQMSGCMAISLARCYVPRLSFRAASASYSGSPWSESRSGWRRSDAR